MIDARAYAIDTLLLLAAEPSVQAGLFPEWVEAAEEIALRVQDAVMYAQDQPGSVPADVLALLARADRAFAGFGKGSGWDRRALHEHVTWVSVRRDARKMLEALHIPLRTPTLSDMFVQGDEEP